MPAISSRPPRLAVALAPRPLPGCHPGHRARALPRARQTTPALPPAHLVGHLVGHLDSSPLVGISPAALDLMTVAFGLTGVGMGRTAAEIFLSRAGRATRAPCLAMLGGSAGVMLLPAATAPTATCTIFALSAFAVEHQLAPYLEAQLAPHDAADLTLLLHVGLPVLVGSMCMWLAAG